MSRARKKSGVDTSGVLVQVMPYADAPWAPKAGAGLAWAWRVLSGAHEVTGATAGDRAVAEDQAEAASKRVALLEQYGPASRSPLSNWSAYVTKS